MRTFGFLTLAAAAALSLVSAAPAPAPSAAVVHAASADKADAVVARDVEVVGVVGIFAELQAAIVEPINSCREFYVYFIILSSRLTTMNRLHDQAKCYV